MEIDAVEKTHSDEPPLNFFDNAFETYLESLSTEGHRYYLPPDEVVAIAELVGSNVVVARKEGHVYRVIDYHLGCAGPVAVTVMLGAGRGHFERLCTVSEVSEAHNLNEQKRAALEAERRREAEERERERNELRHASRRQLLLQRKRGDENRRIGRRTTQSVVDQGNSRRKMKRRELALEANVNASWKTGGRRTNEKEKKALAMSRRKSTSARGGRRRTWIWTQRPPVCRAAQALVPRIFAPSRLSQFGQVQTGESPSR